MTTTPEHPPSRMNSTQAWVSYLSTVSRAITLIGFDSVKSMAISSLIVDSMLKRNDRPHLLRCLARAIHAAVQARCLLPSNKEQALVGSLTAKGRLVGLFYADNAAAGYVPSKQQEEAFAHFIQNAQLCLTLMSSR